MLAWSFFSRYIFSRRSGALVPTIAFICVAGVAVGVMSFVIVLSVMNGFNQGIFDRILAAEPHMVVSFPEVKGEAELKQSMAYQLLNLEEKLKFQIYEKQDVILRTGDGLFRGGEAHGYNKASLNHFLEGVAKKNGSPIRTWEGKEVHSLDEDEVLIGHDLAQMLGLLEGDQVTLISPEALLLPPSETPTFATATVKGVVMTGVSDVDSKAIFYPRGMALKKLEGSKSRELGIEVRLDDIKGLAALKPRLTKSGAKVETWEERNSSLFFALKLEKLVIFLVLALSALIASFSIVTVLTLLITQKKKDMGILMALGFSPKKTQKLFALIGFYLSSIGIIVGFTLSLSFSLYFESHPLKLLPKVYYETKIPFLVDWYWIGMVAMTCIIMTVLGSWLPSWKIAKMIPSEVLRGNR